MTKLYQDEGKSLPDLKREYGLAYKQTMFLLRYFGIETRTSSESALLDKTRKKYKETCLERYGCENVSQSGEIKEKKKRTSLSNYGVDNIWKKRDFIIERMVAKYGKKSVPNLNGNANSFGWKGISDKKKSERIRKSVDGSRRFWNSLSDDEKNEFMAKRRPREINFESRLERRFQDVLSDMGVSFTRQKWVKNRSYDFHLVGTNVLIEINGDYWHANPQVYSSDSRMWKNGNSHIYANEIWRKDSEKMSLAKKYGYEVIVLWEYDMAKMTDFEIASWIYDRLDAG